MIIIGLTGGIGSGKTTVAQIFEIMNIPVYYTDTEAKRIMGGSVIVRNKLIERFGDTIYIGSELNKTALSALIFGNEDNLAYVNSIVHPEVRKDFLQWKESYANQPVVVIESAILFESGFDNLVDKTLTVAAPIEKKIERIMLRDNTNRETILKRISSQLPDEAKTVRSDAVIINDDIQPLIPQVEHLICSNS